MILAISSSDGISMNCEECLSVYRQLIEYLRQRELDWIVTQVKQSIDEGKTIELKNQNQITIEEYTPKEKLILLIDAIERGWIDTLDMKQKIYDFNEDLKNNLDYPVSINTSKIFFAETAIEADERYDYGSHILDLQRDSEEQKQELSLLKESLERLRLEALKSDD
jgi:hypothetical protein